MESPRETIVTAHAAEVFAAIEGKPHCSDDQLRAQAEILAGLFDVAIDKGVVHRNGRMSVVTNGIHAFIFQTDRLHRYINNYIRIDYGEHEDEGESTQHAAMSAPRSPGQES